MDSFIVVEKERLGVLEEIEDHFLLLRDVVDEYAVASTDAAGHILEWSPRAEQIFGITREEAHGLPFGHLYTASSGACSFAAAMGQASYRGRHNHECTLQTKRGDRLKARISIEPCEREPGLPHGYLLVIKVLTPDMVPPAVSTIASRHLRLYYEIADETDRQEVGAFFATQTSTYFDDLQRSLGEQDLRSSEEIARQLEKLFLCLGCEPMARIHAQVQAYIRHHDWSSAQQSLAAMRAMMEEEVK
jgi:PAS domain S-box-containing protein